MTEQMKNLFAKDNLGGLAVWVSRAVVLLGVIGIYFLDGIYARQEQFDALDNRIQDVERTLLIMAEEARVSDRHRRLLDDHEDRIREVERAVYRNVTGQE